MAFGVQLRSKYPELCRKGVRRKGSVMQSVESGLRVRESLAKITSAARLIWCALTPAGARLRPFFMTAVRRECWKGGSSSKVPSRHSPSHIVDGLTSTFRAKGERGHRRRDGGYGGISTARDDSPGEGWGASRSCSEAPVANRYCARCI